MKVRRHFIKIERNSYWLELINTWQKSGKKANQFCKENCIAVSCFYQWRKRLKPDYPLRTSKSPAHVKSALQKALFVPVQITPEESTLPKQKHIDGFILHYPNGCYVSLTNGFDLQMLSYLNKVMGV